MPVPDLEWLIQSPCGIQTTMPRKLQRQSTPFLLEGPPWGLASENDRDKLKNEIEECLQHSEKNQFMTEAGGKALELLKQRCTLVV